MLRFHLVTTYTLFPCSNSSPQSLDIKLIRSLHVCSQLDLAELQQPPPSRPVSMTDSITNFVATTTMQGGQGPSKEEIDNSHFRGALREMIGALNMDDPNAAVQWVIDAAKPKTVGARSWFVKRKALLYKVTRHQFCHKLQSVRDEVRAHSMSIMLVHHGVAPSSR